MPSIQMGIVAVMYTVCLTCLEAMNLAGYRIMYHLLALRRFNSKEKSGFHRLDDQSRPPEPPVDAGLIQIQDPRHALENCAVSPITGIPQMGHLFVDP